MDKFDGYKKQLEKDLNDESKPWSKYLKLVEEKTNVPRLYLFFGKKEIFFIILNLSYYERNESPLKDVQCPKF